MRTSDLFEIFHTELVPAMEIMPGDMVKIYGNWILVTKCEFLLDKGSLPLAFEHTYNGVTYADPTKKIVRIPRSSISSNGMSSVLQKHKKEQLGCAVYMEKKYA